MSENVKYSSNIVLEGKNEKQIIRNLKKFLNFYYSNFSDIGDLINNKKSFPISCTFGIIPSSGHI